MENVGSQLTYDKFSKMLSAAGVPAASIAANKLWTEMGARGITDTIDRETFLRVMGRTKVSDVIGNRSRTGTPDISYTEHRRCITPTRPRPSVPQSPFTHSPMATARPAVNPFSPVHQTASPAYPAAPMSPEILQQHRDLDEIGTRLRDLSRHEYLTKKEASLHELHEEQRLANDNLAMKEHKLSRKEEKLSKLQAAAEGKAVTNDGMQEVLESTTDDIAKRERALKKKEEQLIVRDGRVKQREAILASREIAATGNEKNIAEKEEVLRRREGRQTSFKSLPEETLSVENELVPPHYCCGSKCGMHRHPAAHRTTSPSSVGMKKREATISSAERRLHEREDMLNSKYEASTQQTRIREAALDAREASLTELENRLLALQHEQTKLPEEQQKLREANRLLQERQAALDGKEAELDGLEDELKRQNRRLKVDLTKKTELKVLESALVDKEYTIKEHEEALARLRQRLDEREKNEGRGWRGVAEKGAALSAEMGAVERRLELQADEMKRRERAVEEREDRLSHRESYLAGREEGAHKDRQMLDDEEGDMRTRLDGRMQKLSDKHDMLDAMIAKQEKKGEDLEAFSKELESGESLLREAARKILSGRNMVVDPNLTAPQLAKKAADMLEETGEVLQQRSIEYQEKAALLDAKQAELQDLEEALKLKEQRYIEQSMEAADIQEQSQVMHKSLLHEQQLLDASRKKLLERERDLQNKEQHNADGWSALTRTCRLIRST